MSDQEWLWFVMKFKDDGDHEIIDSYTKPEKAAERAYKMNDAHLPSDPACWRVDYYFIEARPVIATIEAEEGELNGCNVNPTETIPQDDFSDWERN